MKVWLSSMLLVLRVIICIMLRLVWMLELVRIVSLFFIVLVIVGSVWVLDSMLLSWWLLWLEMMMLLVLNFIVFLVFLGLRMFLIIIGLF